METHGQPTIYGDLVVYVEDHVDNLPGAGTDIYADPDSLDLICWQFGWNHVFSSSYSVADSFFQFCDFHLIFFTDTIFNETYIILEKEEDGNNYWGLYAWNPLACRSNVTIMSPHPKKDFNTAQEGAYAFRYNQAQAFMTTGTHRCNAIDTSPCSGTTSVCSGSAAPFRISDMAHTKTSIFQRTTEILLTHLADPFFIQLHGFTKDSTDPYLILSNSSKDLPASFDYLSQLATSLEDIDSVLTFEIAHLNPAWYRLIGLTNTQGRFINGSADPCIQNSPGNSGRFLHIEQEKSRLRETPTGWHKIAMAIQESFRAISIDSTVIIQGRIAALDSINLSFSHFHPVDSAIIEASGSINLLPGFSSDSAGIIDFRIKSP